MKKKCNSCGKEKELNKDNFEPRKDSKDGFINKCKDCRNADRRKLYKKSENSRVWSNEENLVLIKYYPIISGKEISEKYLPNRTVRQINEHASKILKLKKEIYSNSWKMEEIDYLENNYKNSNISLEEMSNFLNKNKPAIVARANSLGMIRDNSIWCKREIELLDKYYPCMSNEDLKNIYLTEKTIHQIVSYANKHNIFKDKNYLKGMYKERRTNLYNKLSSDELKELRLTKPQIIVNNILDELNIKFENEKPFKFYEVDNYLIDSKLIIEVQGDYFHYNPKFLFNEKHKSKALRKDKAKNTFFINKYNINILYLWEDDLKNNKDLCKKLIINYIDNYGILENYHSFNYSLVNNNLILLDNLYAINY
jgi:very-short-patch-repair endonuclease